MAAEDGPLGRDGTAVEYATIVGDDAGLAIVEFVAGRPGSLVCLPATAGAGPPRR